MAIEDFRAVDGGTPIEADVCIVGSGPAGWILAEELEGSGLSVLVLESGGLDPHPDLDALNQTSDLGVPLYNGRARALGGASLLWSGRCIAFDDIDYEERFWVPLSGWPVNARTLAPHMNSAAAHLRAFPCHAADGTAAEPPSPSPRPDVDPALLSTVRWENAPPVDSGQLLRASRNPDLRVLLHATVTHLNTDASGKQVTSVEISDPAGRRAEVRARVVVLCAGGIENARLLLYSNRVMKAGLGNTHDVVGRYFMDHPRDIRMIAQVDPVHAARMRALFGAYLVQGPHGQTAFSYGFALSPERQRREGLLNCAAWPFEVRSEDDPLNALRRLASRRSEHAIRDLRRVVGQPRDVARALRSKLEQGVFNYKVDQTGFLIASEQVPDPESRVTLGTQRDRLGLPTSEIHWRIGSLERASQAALARSIAREFKRLGLPPVTLADWVRSVRYEDARFNDGCHPSGTTRMASDPGHGVVDENCKVHGVDGLYIAGSSIFPTAGHANPTLMIGAFAVRLSHHLKETMLNRSAGVSRNLAVGAALPVR